ncbi:RNA-binding S4 domain-containing protein [Oceanomicrobium pacificus]|uniref:RNA-binding S4 domain-containing protein n=1 Tax=Oceanomicrobium pacificus TaxID=2692916 RepID=A0A6B0TS24_9RHOB|nr:RNA-binding S4 domain-containing protein [Oceanomicrobium pacificus]MXU63823.1 RNA-binding S4 domain-containing protein [Oceanomicrobium pacificus]
MVEDTGSQRLDKWLWYARFFKTRSLAAKQVTSGHVRVNSTRQTKAATQVKSGDVLTFAQGRQVRVIEVLLPGSRRGPASEAQELYRDISPPEAPVKNDIPQNPRFEGKARPTKKDRRALDKFGS